MRTFIQNKSGSKISATKEDYVRAIYILRENGLGTGVTQVADKLGLSKSTVSERVNELEKDGFVTAAPYAEIELTKAGEEVGKKMTYKHRLIEVFLNQTLCIPKEQVHQEAERLEHAFSDAVIQKLAEFLKHPKSDPHGSSLPKIKSWK